MRNIPTSVVKCLLLPEKQSTKLDHHNTNLSKQFAEKKPLKNLDLEQKECAEKRLGVCQKGATTTFTVGLAQMKACIFSHGILWKLKMGCINNSQHLHQRQTQKYCQSIANKDGSVVFLLWTCWLQQPHGNAAPFWFQSSNCTTPISW